MCSLDQTKNNENRELINLLSMEIGRLNQVCMKRAIRLRQALDANGILRTTLICIDLIELENIEDFKKVKELIRDTLNIKETA